MDGEEGNIMVVFCGVLFLLFVPVLNVFSASQRSRKLQNAANKTPKDLMTLKTGAFIVAPVSERFALS